MDVLWLAPSAWWGLAALAVPVAIHLLTRQQTRRVPFPTLRFLHATRLAALRRRTIRDWPLLVIRLAVLTAAVAALAAPVFISNARRVEWQTRVARAIVVAPARATDAAQERLISEETSASFASATFRPSTRLPDGLRDAVNWLQRQPPAAREIVIVGDLKEDALTAADLALVPAPIGLRFTPLPGAANVTEVIDVSSARVSVGEPGTRVEYAAVDRHAPPAATQRIGVRAAPDQVRFAEASRDAVLAHGVRFDRAGDRRLLVVFEGADTGDLQLRQPADHFWMREALARLSGMRGGQFGDTLVVLVPQRAQGIATVHVIDRAARAAFAEDWRELEVRRIPASRLAQWSRPSEPVADAPVSDEGDRRWLWGAVLLLMAIEAFVRRSSTSAAVEEHPIEEPRVA